MPERGRAEPKPTRETRHFWDGTQAGELRLQRLRCCALYAGISISIASVVTEGPR